MPARSTNAGVPTREASGSARSTSTSLDWNRLAHRCAIGVLLVLASVQLYLQARGKQYGIDFRGGTWNAGRALLNGNSPFPPASAHLLLERPNGFITPLLLAVIGAPFSILPFGVAVVAFNLVCTAALLGAVRLLQVRDKSVYVLAICSFPFVSSLALGQPDGIFALTAAIAWRHRSSSIGAVAVGALIAAKLLAGPLIIWLLMTRRFREAVIATGSAIAVLLGSWALIGFQGLTSYPRLLSADATAFEGRAHSLVTAFVRTGTSPGVATGLAILTAVAVGVAIVMAAGGSDLGWFTAPLLVGLLASPVMWQHYLVLVFIPLAATRRLRDPVVWLLTIALWLSPSETPATLWQAWLIPTLAGAIALRIAWLARSPGPSLSVTSGRLARTPSR